MGKVHTWLGECPASYISDIRLNKWVYLIIFYSNPGCFMYYNVLTFISMQGVCDW